QAVYQESRYQNVAIVAMNRDEDTATISQFMQQNGYTFPVALDPGLSVAESYQVYAIPETFLIGPDGVVRVKKIGAFLNKGELESSLNMIVR
ncbi:MAG: TlpA disulfide reductase family protein, partial [Dehalococcoidia bacterium]|nr:TlpA disulfide reductase family protein [Dehalococcoidia bacterium]